METEFDARKTGGFLTNEQWTCCGGVPLQQEERCQVCGECYEEDEGMEEDYSMISIGYGGLVNLTEQDSLTVKARRALMRVSPVQIKFGDTREIKK